ncbi:MAG TPA: hypothetical protein VFK41_06085 [Nocardioidaceae bacterium]|nr:hypothetical protein [Nocardioidaceae bacterium]
MGVSATGERGIRPRTVRFLFYLVLAALMTIIYLVAPVVVPGLHQAAEDRCNVLNGSDYRSYRVEWIVPQPPQWDRPHWICRDRRDLDKPGINFGWWVNPWQDLQELEKEQQGL